jgi:hypothetical protein
MTPRTLRTPRRATTKTKTKMKKMGMNTTGGLKKGTMKATAMEKRAMRIRTRTRASEVEGEKSDEDNKSMGEAGGLGAEKVGSEIRAEWHLDSIKGLLAPPTSVVFTFSGT